MNAVLDEAYHQHEARTASRAGAELQGHVLRECRHVEAARTGDHRYGDLLPNWRGVLSDRRRLPAWVARPRRSRAEIDIIVCDPRGPIAAECIFNARTGGPADVDRRFGERWIAARIVGSDFRLAPRETARQIGQDAAECAADAGPHRPKIVERGVEWRRSRGRPVTRTNERHIRRWAAGLLPG